jgi:hypothetical protein
MQETQGRGFVFVFSCWSVVGRPRRSRLLDTLVAAIAEMFFVVGGNRESIVTDNRQTN